MYIYMYSLLLGRLSVNSFGWLTQRASFYWRKLSTENTEEQYSRTRPFYEDCPHKCTLGPSVMSNILWLWDWTEDGGKQELLFACLTETIERRCGCNVSRASSLLLLCVGINAAGKWKFSWFLQILAVLQRNNISCIFSYATTLSREGPGEFWGIN